MTTARKLFIILILLCLAASGITACTKKYDEEDVKKYIRENMHISSFEVLSGPEDVKGEDGYTDQEWTISTDEFALEDDLVFHVYNDMYYSMEWTTNSLTNDLLYRKQLLLLDVCSLPDGTRIEEEKNSSGRVWSLSIVYPLSGRADLTKAASVISDLQASFSSVPGLKDTEFPFCLEVHVSDPEAEACIAGREYLFCFSSMTAPTEISSHLSALSDDYLMDCIEMGLLDRMDEYSIPERSAVIRADKNNTEIKRINEDTAAYPGYSYNYYYDIPYGTLYRILDQEGYELTGSWKAFSFTGTDGQTHTFAYGDKNNVITVDEINEITGLNLDDGADLQEIVVGRDMLVLFDKDADTFASELLDLDGNYFRDVRVSGGEVHIRGKGRQFSRLRKKIQDRLDQLAVMLRTYNGGYTFVYDNMSMVYQGIKIRMGTDVPVETARKVVDEAAALTAFSQVLNQGKVYDWSLEVVFATWKDGQSENILSFTLPQDEIDYEAVYRALK